ncbi:MAG: sugar phosphate isomerase/epimerase [Candidatus Hydrogenedentes bacterium]|nr:sugar phosphate isomerase/epimerase [Candidatus Hydrogenedentota bacterium]
MYVGMLTAPLQSKNIFELIDFAEIANIKGLEVSTYPGSKHLDPLRTEYRLVKEIRSKLEEKGRLISSLAYYDCGITEPKKSRKVQEIASKVIDLANSLGVEVVCMLSGFPIRGLSKIQTIRDYLPGCFNPIVKYARKKRVKIAIENWYMTNLQGLDTFEEMFKVIPDENFGLNFDPSHLVHQECDYLLAVKSFRDRIFHTHAKDTYIDEDLKKKVGVYSEGWWRYVLPGFGIVRWGEYISCLKHCGYDGVLSIEHEDSSQPLEEGFLKAAWFLEPYC